MLDLSKKRWSVERKMSKAELVFDQLRSEAERREFVALISYSDEDGPLMISFDEIGGGRRLVIVQVQ